jgi:hypothetical protein
MRIAFPFFILIGFCRRSGNSGRLMQVVIARLLERSPNEYGSATPMSGLGPQ